MKTLILITSCFLLLTSYCFPQHNETDTLYVDSLGVVSDSTDLNQYKLIDIKFVTTTFTSDTFFVQTKNLPGGTWDDLYYLDQTGAKIRSHIVVHAGKLIQLHPVMFFGTLRYVRFIPDDAEADDRTIVIYKGLYP